MQARSASLCCPSISAICTLGQNLARCPRTILEVGWWLRASSTVCVCAEGASQNRDVVPRDRQALRYLTEAWPYPCCIWTMLAVWCDQFVWLRSDVGRVQLVWFHSLCGVFIWYATPPKQQIGGPLSAGFQHIGWQTQLPTDLDLCPHPQTHLSFGCCTVTWSHMETHIPRFS